MTEEYKRCIVCNRLLSRTNYSTPKTRHDINVCLPCRKDADDQAREIFKKKPIADDE